MHRHHYGDASHHEPKTTPVPNFTRHVIDISSDEADLELGLRSSDDESLSEHSELRPRRRDLLHLHKRPKIRPDPFKQAKSPRKRKEGSPKTQTCNSAPTRNDSMATLSFPHKAQGDNRATLTFRNPPEPGPSQLPQSGAKLAELQRLRAERQAMNKCPYYYDARLEQQMYRGPGYEKYPVVLGSVEGHKEICNKWDAQNSERRRLREAQLAVTDPDVQPKPDQDNPLAPAGSSPAPTEDEKKCLQEVLQIFPQIQHRFVIQKLRERQFQLYDVLNEGLLEFPTSAEIVAEIAELHTYPKENTSKRKSREVEPDDETGIKIERVKDVPKNKMYYKECIILLAREFDHVPTHYISKVMDEKAALFDAYFHLYNTESAFFSTPAHSRPYRRLRTARGELELKYQLNYKDHRESHQYVGVVNEFQAARQHVAKEALRASKQREKEEEEATNLAIHKAEGALIECQCCFDEEIPINRAVSCEGDQGHFFCFTCVSRLAEAQVGAMKHEMCCMHASGCNAVLSPDGIGQAVPIKIFDKLAFNQQQAEISAAGIEGLEHCPFCDFKAICDPVEVDSVFLCQNPDCGWSTCRKCHELSHLPKSCVEAKADRGLSARHLVEEARSEAMMRQCPKCKVKIIKEHGCNKMLCSACRCLMCYVCKADISSGKENGYEHFNRFGATCKLYDHNEIDRHVIEADEAEREAIKRAKAADSEVDEDDLRVETKRGDDRGVAKEKVKKLRETAHRPAGVRRQFGAQIEAQMNQVRNMAAVNMLPFVGGDARNAVDPFAGMRQYNNILGPQRQRGECYPQMQHDLTIPWAQVHARQQQEVAQRYPELVGIRPVLPQYGAMPFPGLDPYGMRQLPRMAPMEARQPGAGATGNAYVGVGADAAFMRTMDPMLARWLEGSDARPYGL